MDPKDESKTTKPGAPQTTGQSSAGKEASTSQTTTTYTEDQINKRISDALAKAGRDAKALEAREAKLKDLDAREKALKEKEDAAEKLREEAELEAIRDDPEKLSVYEYRKKVKEQEAAVKAERKKLEEERLAFNDKLTRAEKIERSTTMGEIAREFKDGDLTVLEKLCDDLGIGSEPEKIRAVAAVKWQKLDAKPEDDGIVPDSGVTSGGGKADPLKARYPTMFKK